MSCVARERWTQNDPKRRRGDVERRSLHARPWPERAHQIVEKGIPIFGGDLGAPIHHLVDLSVPLGAREALLADDIVIMAGDAATLE
jgi:hypothetical protein